MKPQRYRIKLQNMEDDNIGLTDYSVSRQGSYYLFSRRKVALD